VPLTGGEKSLKPCGYRLIRRERGSTREGVDQRRIVRFE